MFKSKNYFAAFVVLLALAGLFALSQATLNLFTETASAAGPFPQGAIIAWNKTSGPIPSGWAVCDGTNGTPDLRGRFLRGVATFADVGKMEGQETHGHTVSGGITQNPRNSIPDAWGDTDFTRTNTPQTTGLDHTHKFSASTTEDGNIPPSYTVIFLMKK